MYKPMRVDSSIIALLKSPLIEVIMMANLVVEEVIKEVHGRSRGVPVLIVVALVAVAMHGVDGRGSAARQSTLGTRLYPLSAFTSTAVCEET